MNRPVSDDTLQEMKAYYRERAREYDEWFNRQGRFDRGSATNARWFAEIDEMFAAFEALNLSGDVLELAPGDRLIIVSDGVHAAPQHDPFGDSALVAAVSSSRLLSAQETVRHLMAAMHEHNRGAELDDDAVVVCVDWNGRAE